MSHTSYISCEVAAANFNFGNYMFEKKMELTLKGYALSIINLILTVSGYPVLGIFFGLFAASFFIRSLLLKE